MVVIARGAEAVVRKEGGMVFKDRLEKKYRHPLLDKRLREARSQLEARLLEKAASICKVPGQVSVEGTRIRMEFIDREPIGTALTPAVCEGLGKMVARLHANHIAHGDLTTSNVLEGPVIIDFGLAKSTSRIEDFAMDLHLFKSCLHSRHPGIAVECFDAFLKGYADRFDGADGVRKRMAAIELRGRYQVRTV